MTFDPYIIHISRDTPRAESRAIEQTEHDNNDSRIAIHTNGGDEGRIECILGKSKQHTSLAYTRVADQ